MTCSGVRWEVADRDAELLRHELLERIGELAGLPQAEQLKEKKRRTVYRVTLSDGRLMVVKVFRVSSVLDRLKTRWVRDPAAAEWRASRCLEARGVPASRAAALGRPMGRGGPVAAYLVIEATVDALGANWFLKELGPKHDASSAEAKLGFTRELAAFVRRVHDAGVRHDDLHAGNILVRRGARSPDERFVLIDLQRVRVGRSPRMRHRVEAIAKVLSAFGVREAITPQVRAQFLESYLAAGQPLRGQGAALARVLDLIERRQAARLVSRSRRCLRNTTQFVVEEARGWRIYHRRGWAVAELLALLEEHRRAGQARVVIRLARGGKRCVLEVSEFAPPRGLRRLWRAATRWPAVREYARAHRRRLRTKVGPLPVAALVRLSGEERGGSVCVLRLAAEGDPAEPPPELPQGSAAPPPT